MAAESEEQLRAQLLEERTALAKAVDALRGELGEATDVKSKLQSKLPLAATGAFGLAFVKAGGVGATMRLLFRRGRERHGRATAGRYTPSDRG